MRGLYNYLPRMTGEPVMDMFIYIVIAGLLAWAAYEIHWNMKYFKEVSPVRLDRGVVTDMDYTPPRSRTVGKTTTYSPAKHEVYIKFEVIGDQDFNDEDLYETVRMDDNVTAEYAEVTRVEKADPTKREFMYYDVISVTSEKGRRVRL